MSPSGSRRYAALLPGAMTYSLPRNSSSSGDFLSWLVEQGESGDGMEPALRMGAVMWWYWMVRGHLSEGRKFLERALAASADVAASLRVKALNALQLLAFSQDDLSRVEALCEESLK